MMGALRFVTDRGLAPGALPRITLAAALGALLFCLLVVAVNWLTGGRYETVLIGAGIAGVTVVGYQIFVGNTGIVSFGHPAFVAIGAYAAGLVAVPPDIKAATLPDLPDFLAHLSLGLVPAMVIGGLAAVVVALVIGPVVMRLAGATAGIMTFGLLVIANDVLRNAETFTRGTQTFFGVPKSAGPVAVFATLVLAVVLAALFKFSPAGLRARAVREDPLAAEIAGISVVRARLWAWVLSAFVTGVGGALLAHNLTAFSPKSFYLNLVVPMMVMAVLGGMGSVLGALGGTALITAWQELMRAVEGGGLGIKVPVGFSELTLGVGLALLLYWRPHGVFGQLELDFRRRRGAAPRLPEPPS